jgi:predicted 2-oxoglutarate/Fe(II)-dependent dioxygenase YbiX
LAARCRAATRERVREHVCLNLHRDAFLQEHCAAPCAALLQRMRAAAPRAWDVPNNLTVRCIELHTYAPGGGLEAAGHRDNGSALSLSLLLTDAAAFDGGEFVTYAAGAPVCHDVGRGDAVLFPSEKVHNVTTVTRGLRQSLVVELWQGATNVKDRFG